MEKYLTPINIILFLVFFTLVGSGLTLELRFDEKAKMTIAGFDREEWGEFHFFTALTFIFVVVLHLWSNFGWLKTLYRRNKLLIFLISVAFVVVLVLVAFLPASYQS